MIQLQLLSRIIEAKDFSIVENNMLTEEYFVGYEDEYNYIREHYMKYGNVPDKASFLGKFPDVELVTVEESERYLIDTAREEYLYYKAVPVIQEAAKLLKTDANAAAEYLVNEMKHLQPNYNIVGIDIIKNGKIRYNEYLRRRTNPEEWFFPTGFAELDSIIHGLQRKDELVVLFARTNQGKSWIAEKICVNVWQLGFNIGYISPEMGADSIGFRFDTLKQNFSNIGLMHGSDKIDDTEYESYIDSLASENDNKFLVTRPKDDFDNKITVSKIKNWATQNQLDFVCVDGITYMTDERYKRGDNKTTSLTNISEDLMSLSGELQIPILVVVQANRGGVIQDKSSDGTPELESIRDSDGIAHNASLVLSIRQKAGSVLEIGVKKQRNGAVGGKVSYDWNIDKGIFSYIQEDDDSYEEENKEETKQKKSRSNEDCF